MNIQVSTQCELRSGQKYLHTVNQIMEKKPIIGKMFNLRLPFPINNLLGLTIRYILASCKTIITLHINILRSYVRLGDL